MLVAPVVGRVTNLSISSYQVPLASKYRPAAQGHRLHQCGDERMRECWDLAACPLLAILAVGEEQSPDSYPDKGPSTQIKVATRNRNCDSEYRSHKHPVF